ncbi:MAG: transcription-repair coupling factor, partial [Gammaproteobacteria bacterium]|nr:transcription-repair coupling factor [Gammaproteobacteria bacterium]
MASAFVPEWLLNPPLPGRAETLGWARLHGSAAALAVAEAAQSMATAAAAGDGDGDRQSNAGVTVVVLEDSRQLQVLESELGFFLGDGAGADAIAATTNTPAIPVLAFPGWECLPYDVFSPPPHITSERLRILSALPSANHSVLLTTCANLMQRLPPVAYIAGQCFELQRGQRIDMHALRERLSAAHYAAVRQVMAAGEFALRGGLVDIFPVGADLPFRLDLFDDEIESIKYFDPDTQRSGAAAERISLLPAREFPLTEASIQLFREAFRREFEGDPRAQKTYTEVSRGQLPAGIEFFFPLFFERTATLFDYLDGGRALWILPANLDQTARLHWAEIDDRHRNANVDSQRRVLPPQRLYLSPRELRERLSAARRVMRYAGTGPSGRGRGKTVWKAATAPPPELPVEPR